MVFAFLFLASLSMIFSCIRVAADSIVLSFLRLSDIPWHIPLLYPFIYH